MQRKSDVYRGIFFHFSKLGPVHTLLHPVIGRPGASWSLCRPFNGTQNPDWVLVLARAVRRWAAFRGVPRLNLSELPLCNENQFPQLGPYWIERSNCTASTPRNA